MQRDLNLIGRCVLSSPHKPISHRAAAVVSDVALDSAVSVQLLRSTLGRSDRDKTPLICVLRDASRQAQIQARALGARELVPADASAADLIETVLRITGATEQGSDVATCARDAGRALAVALDAVEDGVEVCAANVSAGADHVLNAIGAGGIRSWLDVVWRYDDITYQHVLLVAGLAADFGRKLGFSELDMRLITSAALVHDIGKALIPLEILNKPGPLTTAEMEIMRSHAALGYDALAKHGGFDPQLLGVVRSHHEQLDGGGYPDGLVGDEIARVVRMVAICDIYAALIENRPYRAPLGQSEALGIMDDMGGKLDRNLLAAFVEMTGSAISDPPAAASPVGRAPSCRTGGLKLGAAAEG